MATLENIEIKDLEVEEVPATSAVLMASAHHLGVECDTDFKNFMGCRYHTKDPRQCIEEGKSATKCALDFFRKLKGACNEEFAAYWTCLDNNNQEFGYCRTPQKKYDACVLEKLNVATDRPDISY